MNKNLIGLNAGKVWQLLNNNKRWSYSELKEAVGLSDRDLNAAIGWLAREDKIDFETEGGNDGSVVILGGLIFVNFPLCIHLC